MDKRGVVYGIAAYTIWGFLPLYWHALSDLSASEILVHRIIWSFVFLLILLAFLRRWTWANELVRDRQRMIIISVSAVLLAMNWFLYIWAVNAGFVIETSLGYFINPLVNVLLGTLFLHERLRSGQWLAVGIATLGVGYLAVSYGSLPWIALSLAFSFGIYGLLKKKVHIGAAEGLTAEMSLLFIPALAYLLFIKGNGTAVIGNSDLTTLILILGCGVVTAVPLIFFSAAARRIPLSMMGILQYIAPTLQFLIGVYIFKEPFTSELLVGFVMIWFALLIYTVEGIWKHNFQSQAPLTDL